MRYSVLLAVIAAMISGVASAVPLTWTIFTDERVSGQFDFDAEAEPGAIDAYSNINIDALLAPHDGADPDFSNANLLKTEGIYNWLELYFDEPLTPAGGIVTFNFGFEVDEPVESGTGNIPCPEGSESDEGFCGYDFEGFVQAETQAVDAPATLALLGLGLIVLGLSRRQRT